MTRPVASPVVKRTMPNAPDAEQAVLGAILFDNAALPRVLEIMVGPDDFYLSRHQRIFQIMVEMFERGEPIDLVTLAERMRGPGLLDTVGGVSYADLADLSEAMPTAANVDAYARIVKEKSVLRNLIRAATHIVEEGIQEKRDVYEFLDYAEARIFEISQAKFRPASVSMKEIVRDSFKMIEALYERKGTLTGVATGFTDLDKMTSGLQPAELIIIAGRPAMGKTALTLNIAAHAALKGNIGVAIFSLEMAREQLALRMLSSLARVEAQRIRGGFLGEADWPKLTRAAGVLADAPIYIDDSAALTALELRAKARRLKAEKTIGLIIVDYLQLMRGRADVERREVEISEISRSLKALAKEVRVPVVAVSQLNRAPEARSDRRPQLADLRESGAIEQDADLIAFVYREEMYHRDKEEVKGLAEVIVGKQRNGPTGIVPLVFMDKFATFVDRETRHEG